MSQTTCQDSVQDRADVVAHELAHDRAEDKDWQSGMEARQKNIETNLNANTRLTLKLVDDTAEIIQFFEAAREGLRVLGWIGKAVKWITPVIAAVAAGVAMWHEAFKH